MDEGNVAMK